MAKKLPSDRVTIAVFDKGTGLIKQVVRCTREDAEKQHLPWPGHHFQDVTHDDVERPHPSEHMVCLKTGKLLPRIAPRDEVADAKERELVHAHRAHLTAFTSSASGQPLEYSADPADLIAMTHAAIIGGDLKLMDGSYVAHTADQTKQVMADYQKHSRDGRDRLAGHKAKLAKAKTADAVAKIEWGGK